MRESSKLGLAVAVLVAAISWSVGTASAATSVYVANSGASSTSATGVSQFDVGAGGALAPKATPSVAAGGFPEGVAISPDGSSLYVTNHGGSPWSVSQYGIAANGSLAPKATASVLSGSMPSGIVVSPDGKSVYVTNSGFFGPPGPGGVSQYDVGPGGALTPKATPTVTTGNSPLGIAISPDGKSVYVTNNYTSSGTAGLSQYDVGAGGALSAKATPTVDTVGQPDGVVVSPDGKSVYVASIGGGVSQYNVGADGSLTPKAPAAVASGSTPSGIAISPDGSSVYVTDAFSQTTNGVYQYDVSPLTGELAPKTPAAVNTGIYPRGIAVSADGLSVYVTNSGANAGTSGIKQYDVGAGGALAPKATPFATTGSSPYGIAVTPGPGRPTVTIIKPPDGANYAANSAVNASYSCSPGVSGGVLKSGAAGCSGPVPSGSPINTSSAGVHQFSVTATDTDGKTATLTHSYTVGPAGPPTASIASPADGTTYLQGRPVNASYMCSAGTNGLLKAGAAGCSGPVPSGSPIDTNTLGPHTFAVTATQTDGQSFKVTSSYTVSATPPGPPSATITTPADGATYKAAQVVSASYSCLPGPNGGVLKVGSDGCQGTVANGSSISTTPGAHAFTVLAADTDGQSATVTSHYTVTDTPAPAGPGLPAGLDFTWSPKADVLVAGAPAGGVQFQATPAAGVKYEWDFDYSAADGFRADASASGTSPLHSFTADGAHDTDKVAGANGLRLRVYTVTLRATAADGTSTEVSHQLVVTPNQPPQVDFVVGGAHNANKPTILLPIATDPAGPRVADHIDHIEWSFDTPKLYPAGDPRATDLICAADGSGCHAPDGAQPGSWFSQGDGHQAVVNFFARGLAAHGLPELSTLDMNALPTVGPDGQPLTGGLSVFDIQGGFTVHHDLRAAYLYDNATLLQQSTFALDAGEATGAKLLSGVPLASADAAAPVPRARASAIKVSPFSSTILQSNPLLSTFRDLAGQQLDWRQVTLTAVDTAGVRTSITRAVPLSPVAPPELKANFVDLTTATLPEPHPITTADTLAFDAAGTQDPGGRIAYYTVEVGKPQTCGAFNPTQQTQGGIPVPPGSMSINPPVDGYRPGESFFAQPSGVGAGLAIAAGPAGALRAQAANPRNILNVGFAAAPLHAYGADYGPIALPTLGEKLAQGRVLHHCGGDVSAQGDAFNVRNIVPEVFMTAQGAAARPPAPGETTRCPDPGAPLPIGGHRRRQPLQYATTALVTSDPANLRFRIPCAGTYSVTVAAYNDAGLGAIQRTDNIVVERASGPCENVVGRVKLGSKTLGFSGECVAVTGNRDHFATQAALTINGVMLRPTNGGTLHLDTVSGNQALYASDVHGRAGGVEVVLEGGPIARFAQFDQQTAVAFIEGQQDPAVFAGAMYHGSPVSQAVTGGANPDTFHISFNARARQAPGDPPSPCPSGSGDSATTFRVQLPAEFSQTGAKPDSPVVRCGHSDLPTIEITTKPYAKIADLGLGNLGAGSGGVSGVLSITDTAVGPVFIKHGTLSFDTGKGLWHGEITDATLGIGPASYAVSFHITIQDGKLRELGGKVSQLKIVVFPPPDVELDSVNFNIVTDPLTFSAGVGLTALAGVITGDVQMTVRVSPVFLRLEGHLGIAGLPLGNAYVQYDAAKANTISFGGHFGFNFGPVSMDANLDGAISIDSGDFFVHGGGTVCLGICIGSEALMSNIAVALCGSVGLGPFEISAGAAYVFKPGKLELFTGCDLEPYKPAIFKSRDVGGRVIGHISVAPGAVTVAPGTQEEAFQFHGDPSMVGSPTVTLISPAGRRYDTAPTEGDYTFAPPGPVNGIAQAGGALIDRNPVDHVTTVIVANPPPGDWQVVTPPGQLPLASVDVASGQHLPDNTFQAKLAPTGMSLDGITASARAHSAPLTRARIAALRALPPIERGRLITTQVTVPAGLGGSLKFLDVGPTATRAIENLSLTTVAGGVDTSSRKITLAFAPTDDPGPHQIQVIKYQQGIGAAGSLPQRNFVVGGFVVPPTPRPTAPKLTVHRDSAGRVLVDVTPGSAGPLAGDPSATFDLIANTAAGQRIERIIHGYTGRRGAGDVATPLPGGRFRVVLNDIPKTTTVEVFGRMEYANVFGKQSSHRLRCRHCRRGR